MVALCLHFIFLLLVVLDPSIESYDLINAFIVYCQFATFQSPGEYVWLSFINRYRHIISFRRQFKIVLIVVFIDYLYLWILLLHYAIDHVYFFVCHSISFLYPVLCISLKISFRITLITILGLGFLVWFQLSLISSLWNYSSLL